MLKQLVLDASLTAFAQYFKQIGRKAWSIYLFKATKHKFLNNQLQLFNKLRTYLISLWTDSPITSLKTSTKWMRQISTYKMIGCGAYFWHLSALKGYNPLKILKKKSLQTKERTIYTYQKLVYFVLYSLYATHRQIYLQKSTKYFMFYIRLKPCSMAKINENLIIFLHDRLFLVIQFEMTFLWTEQNRTSLDIYFGTLSFNI